MVEIILLLLYFALIGFLTYIIVTHIPMPELFKQVITVVVVVVVVLYLLALMSGHAQLPTLPNFGGMR